MPPAPRSTCCGRQKITAGSIVLLTDGRDIGSKLDAGPGRGPRHGRPACGYSPSVCSRRSSARKTSSLSRERATAAYAEAASPAALRAIYRALSEAACQRVHRSLRLPRRPWTPGAGRGHGERRPWGRRRGVTYRQIPVASVAPFHRSVLDRLISSPVSAAPSALLAAALAWFAVSTILETETKHGEGPRWENSSGLRNHVGKRSGLAQGARAPARPRAPGRPSARSSGRLVGGASRRSWRSVRSRSAPPASSP